MDHCERSLLHQEIANTEEQSTKLIASQQGFTISGQKIGKGVTRYQCAVSSILFRKQFGVETLTVLEVLHKFALTPKCGFSAT